ncbi:unnamed protein product (macronuclear) [Paramecium tetraurelia]|uniref:Uncharacterized protein n=1 Tax=Paramecium tetraurelia TaxID=5888 RepID=A0E958_PARTE|nr:uncharacterized protein GSPATT00024556001 [Paramecium tetraurelia]CAK91825.1 unnamed protein product [Paramecium tetraurelia]|eukprot:XP_001459222.1 hypothetical protein (macronuclear) [Paramecium tetraurelia strain d4-2]
MYKIPKLLKPPHKQSLEFQKMQEELRKSQQAQKEKVDVKIQPEFVVEEDLDEKDYTNFIPLKQEPQKFEQLQHYQPRDYLEEFFDQKGIIKRKQDRKNKMVNAINYEIERNEKCIDQLMQEFQDYQEEINHIQGKVKDLEKEGKNLTILQKLQILEGNLDEALNLEIKEEFKLNPDDEDIDDKLDLMYDNTNNLIDEYEQLKYQILEEEERRREDQEEKELLEQLDDKQIEDRELQHELQRRIEQVKNEGVKLQMQQKLQKLKESTLQRTEMKKASVKNYCRKSKPQQESTQKKKFSDKKQYNMYSQQFGYGKDKITFKPL